MGKISFKEILTKALSAVIVCKMAEGDSPFVTKWEAW